MDSVQSLRELINERLTAAAEEIFTEFEKTIVQYEEEIDRQRRLLDVIWKAERKFHTTDHQHQDVCKEGNGLANQHLCNQENKFCLDQKEAEPPQIKEDQEELCTSQQGEQLVLNQATDTFLSISTDMDSDLSELKPNSDHLLCYNSTVAESPHQDGSKLVASRSTRNETPKPKSHSNCNGAKSSMSEHHCDVDTNEKSIKCDVFGNIFKNKHQIKKHHQIHKGVKPNDCNACGKSFSSRYQLKVHMSIHSGEKRFSCEKCGKRFRQNGHLTVHMRTHTGEKPYSCERCGKSFNHSSSVTVHMRTHTGEKPYSCERCGKHFTQRGQLTIHMRTHTGEKL
ncbi:zinc finger protein 182-like [Acanthochromis polyacanthus]|uniref:zinc finger protein 182-like n=1 Tax=Acanthochromis polyacanthus TaxID=80966 RepID=UPI0022346C91|nr:zinc finger protein 182-like [Acanthochromis polyacanthus]